MGCLGVFERLSEPLSSSVVVDGIDGQVPVALSLLLREMKSGPLADVNVVNLSLQLSPPSATDWWASHAADTCGPGADDDESGTGVCYPSNYDPLIRENAQYGKVSRRIIEAFVRLLPDPPLFVISTGNFSSTYCPQKTTSCAPGTLVPQAGEVLSSETWANRNWNSAIGPNPIPVGGGARQRGTPVPQTAPRSIPTWMATSPYLV